MGDGRHYMGFQLHDRSNYFRHNIMTTGFSRVAKLVIDFPVITVLTIALLWSLVYSHGLRQDMAALERKLHDVVTVIPAAKECSDKVELIAKDCKVEVQEALSRVKPIYIEIEKSAKSADEFNEWMEDL